MRKAATTILVMLSITIWASTGLAKKAKGRKAKKAKEAVVMTVGQPISLERRKETPSFVKAKLRIMDRGNLVYVGKGMWQEQERFILRQLDDGKEVELKAPLAEFFAAHPETFPAAEGTGFPDYFVEKLLFVDREGLRAGIHLVKKERKKKRYSHYHLGWDMKNNVIDRFDLLGVRDKKTVRLLSVMPIAYRPVQKEIILQVQAWRQTNDESKINDQKLIGFAPDAKREIASWTTKLDARRNFLDSDGKRVLIVEYAEQGSAGPLPSGHVLDLETGAKQSFPVPVTSYGATFTPDGKKLYVYSNQARIIWIIDLASGKKIKQVKVGGGGHALAWGPAGRVMLLAHRGLTFLDPKKLTRRQFFPTAKVFSGRAWIPGSVLTKNQAIMRNGKELVIVQLRKKETQP
ncbi:MAG: hypothetical protein JRF33_12255 [Deltaproteobacteria bacterium]|nr:hypothetical protein [Deltaproteobacteria bacterium]